MSDRLFGWSVVVLCVLAVVLILGPLMAAAYYRCDAVGDGLNVDSRWGPIVGCQIRDGDRWVPLDQYRFWLDSEGER